MYRKRLAAVLVNSPKAVEDKLLASYIASALQDWGRNLADDHPLYNSVGVIEIKIGKEKFNIKQVKEFY